MRPDHDRTRLVLVAHLPAGMMSAFGLGVTVARYPPSRRHRLSLQSAPSAPTLNPDCRHRAHVWRLPVVPDREPLLPLCDAPMASTERLLSVSSDPVNLVLRRGRGRVGATVHNPISGHQICFEVELVTKQSANRPANDNADERISVALPN